MVSIPIWFDLKCARLTSEEREDSVSIPIWFDLKQKMLFCMQLFMRFNSYMVRFKEDYYVGDYITFWKFQFLYGSI